MTAAKKGGANERGTYTGKVYIFAKEDLEKLAQTMTAHENGSGQHWSGGYNYGEGRDDQASLDVVKYDTDKFSEFGLANGKTPLTPLISYDSMSLYTSNMDWSWNENAFHDFTSTDGIGHQVEINNDNGVTQIELKVAITGGQVSVTIPKLDLTFNGIVTGDQAKSAGLISDAESTKKQLEQTMQQAKEQQPQPTSNITFSSPKS